MTQNIAEPSGWSKLPLGEVGRWLSGGTPSLSVADYWGGDVPWVSPKDMKTPRLHDAIDHISNSAVAAGATVLPVGAILMVVRGMILAHSVPVARAERPLSFNQDIKAVVCRDRVDSEFLLYWLLSHARRLLSLTTESTHGTKRLPTETLFREVVACPSVEEQRAIATVLSDVDALLAKLDQLIAKKRDLKQAAMQQLLNGRIRLPGHSADWNRVAIGSLAVVLRGASPRPIDSPVWFDDQSQVGWVRISDLPREGMYLRETSQRLSAAGVSRSRPVARGSLIMSIAATVGRPAITEMEACIHDGFVVFSGLRADKRYFFHLLRFMEHGWSKHGQTGSQMNLNTDLIKRTEVDLPSPTEQVAIAEVLCDMDAELTALEARRDKTHQLKQGMMQTLLTGRFRLV